MPQAVTDETAIYYAEHLRATVSGATAGTAFALLKGLYNALQRSKAVPKGVNSFDDHRFARNDDTPTKRPFRESELLAVLAALEKRPTGDALRDAFVLLLLTGCRAEELCGALDVPVRDGAAWFTVQAKKGAKVRRVVPLLHPVGLEIIERRPRAGPLFPELPPTGADAKRGKTISSAFNYVKGRLGLSREVDLHSTRRTWVTMAENNGVDAIRIARYVGHALPTLALALYSGGASEAVQLQTARAVGYSEAVERALRAVSQGTNRPH